VGPSFEQYHRAIFEAWRQLPCTRGHPPPSDRAVLLDLYRRAIPLSRILIALRLAAHRRSPDLPPVRSVAYFTSVIDELADADPSYVAYLDRHLPH
jgi:hypothetical protein